MSEKYGNEVNGDIANDSAQHRRGGEVFDVFRDLGNNGNERDCVCDPRRECGSDSEGCGGGAYRRRGLIPRKRARASCCGRTDRS